MKFNFDPIAYQNASFYLASLLKSLQNYSSVSTPTLFNHLLNFTTRTKNLKHVTQIHSQLVTNAYICLPFLFNNLLNSYAQCGLINKSLLLFSTAHQVPHNSATWTSLITQLSRFNKPFEAFAFFNQMRCSGVSPNEFTLSAILPACADTLIVVHGQQIHSLICKLGYETHVFVGSALLDMYGKCSKISSAVKVFDEMPERNVVSWNSMIVGFLRNELYDKAIAIFREVFRENMIRLDQVSFSTVLSACANMCAPEFGRQVHGIVSKHGLVTLAYVSNSLIYMYSKCGLFDDAVKLFWSIRVRDIVTWNVMINGCVYNEKFKDACNYFWTMRRAGITPDESSYSSFLGAAASLAALWHGTLIHDQITKYGFLSNACVTSSLINMYAKCGSLVDAYRVFEETEDPNICCWSAIIAAYQQHGYASQGIELFEEMLRMGKKPNYITFVSVLSACTHTGSVKEGIKYFDSMTKVHDITPGQEHYACMVDLLGRAGRLDEANRFIDSMPIRPKASVWGALLGACRNHNNIEMGREVAERLFELEPDNPGNYMLLFDMYARNRRSDKAAEVRRMMEVNGVRKETGFSRV